jgi:hypothetical protein
MTSLPEPFRQVSGFGKIIVAKSFLWRREDYFVVAEGICHARTPLTTEEVQWKCLGGDKSGKIERAVTLVML